MERKINKRSEHIEKKSDNRSIKDRGDTVKKIHGDERRKENVNNYKNKLDRGDSEPKIKANKKTYHNRAVKEIGDKNTTEVKTGSKDADDDVVSIRIKKFNKYETVNKIDERGKIRDKSLAITKDIYNSMSISTNKKDIKESNAEDQGRKSNEKREEPKREVKKEEFHTTVNVGKAHARNDPILKLGKDVTISAKKESSNESSKSMSTKTDKESDRKFRKKPIITTLTSKNDASRIYKSVTFVEQKEPTPLQINMPNDALVKKTKVNIDTVKSKVKTDIEVKQKAVTKKASLGYKKKRDRKNHVLSPEVSSISGNLSPRTEVAKWAPSCINRHTKPYYEAWVDTTLAAISRISKKDKLYIEKQNIIQNFQRALEERPDSPLYENFANEKYTGRIKVTQRCRASRPWRAAAAARAPGTRRWGRPRSAPR